MKNRIFKIQAILLPLLFAGYVAIAQSGGTQATIERQKLENIWLSNTLNASGGLIDAPASVANAYFGYDKTKGDFKRVQVGEKIGSIKFHTDGGGVYENLGGMYLWGSFTFTKDDIAGAKWNATLVDPTRDMPFFVADENVSKWKNQDYSLSMKAAFPRLANDHLILGLAADYQVAIAAKQLDPRPLTRLSNFAIRPSVVWDFDGHHSLGALFRYGSYREDGSATNLIHLTDQKGWEMVAPGFFTEGMIASFAGINKLRNYNANSLGAGAQYNYKQDNFKLLINWDYIYKVEDVTCNYTKPQMSGTVKDWRWNLGVAAQYNVTDEDMLFFRYNHSNKNIDGIEYFQTYDNTYEVQSWITDAKYVRSNFNTKIDKFNLDYMVGEGENSYSWKFGVEGALLNDNYIYYVPETTRKIKKILGQINASCNLVASAKSSFMFNIFAGGAKGRKASFDYNGPGKDNPAYKEFARWDYFYMASSYYTLGGDISYNFTGIKGLSSLFVNVGYEHLSPRGEFFKKRNTFGVKVGITF